MAAVAANHMSESFRGSKSDQFTESGPTFTAVNGTASPTPPVRAKSHQEAPKDPSDEANGRPTRPNSRQDRAKSPAQARPSHASSQQERGPSPGQNTVGDRPVAVPTPASIPASTSNPNPNAAQRQDPNDEPPKTHYVSSHSRTPSSQQSKTATTSPQKRKRSDSDDYDNLNRNPTYHSHALPNSPERPRMYGTENGRVHEHDNASPTSSYPPPPEHSRPHPPELYPRPERHQMMRTDYDPRVVDPSIASIAPAPAARPYYSEARMAEALQRENRSYDAMGPRDNFASPDDDDDQHAQQYGDYGANRSSQSGLDMDRKRRKRVFSNRTKTGCMTCRRRKKKCDEQHPECEYHDHHVHGVPARTCCGGRRRGRLFDEASRAPLDVLTERERDGHVADDRCR